MLPEKVTPMMKQWHLCKEKARESILLFRMGDFYEAFYQDATTLAQNLDIALTQRQGIPMSGVPASSIDVYVDRLVSKGFKVAIAEQFNEPSNSESGNKQGPLARDVQRLVTPGTLLTSSFLPEKSNNFIISINRIGTLFGFSCLDLSTGTFLLCEYDNPKELIDEICRLAPTEILSSEKFYKKHADLIKQLQQHLKLTLSEYPDWAFEHQFATQKLASRFEVSSLDGFGLKGLVPAINAAGALLSYIQDKLLLPIEHIAVPKVYGKQKHLRIDSASQVNLELVTSQDPKGKSSLLHIMEKTSTPMGGRLLRRTLLNPFFEIEPIVLRQDSVEFLLTHSDLRNQLRSHLVQIRDLERLMTKISVSLAGPKDIGVLRDSLLACSRICHIMFSQSQLPAFFQKKFAISACLGELISLLTTSLLSELPLRISEGSVFVPDYHEELKRLRYTQEHAKELLWEYQERVRQETQIKKLKICYSQSLGYYIEINNTLAQQLPQYFIRRQSRLHAERFTTAELQRLQDDIIHVSDKLSALEANLFKDLCQKILHNKEAIFTLSQAIADVDYIVSLADLAAQYDYRRPLVDNGETLSIIKGMHPVAQTLLDKGAFIPNDTELHSSHTRMILLTGPNMAGKSTYIRQVALLIIMAQMGSFIPARSAHIGVVDKIFTRIGAGDNLSKGMSTFMVEMVETANILHNVTDRSLVILDEVGRGTSTYDGLAIAQAVVEYLLFTEGKKAKTLFATHYKELTDLELRCPHVENFHAGVKETGEQPIFLYEILKGHSQKSFGVHVAKLAGFPLCVVSRAQQILRQLEGPETVTPPPQDKAQQLMLF